MRPADLQRMLHNFSMWLSSSEVVRSPRLSHLSVQKIHEWVHQEALRRVAKAYESLCKQIRKPENRYEAASTLLGSERPFGRVDLLYQMFCLEEGNESDRDVDQQLKDDSSEDTSEGEREEEEEEEEDGAGAKDMKKKEQI